MAPKFDEENRPKLHFILERIEGTRVHTMSKDDYEKAKLSTNEETELEIRNTPVSQVTQKAGALFSIAQTVSDKYDVVSIGRPAESSDAHDVDRDKYLVWTDLLNHPDLDDMVNKASTNLDSDLIEYIDTRTFWVLQEPDTDHHMTQAQLSTLFPVTFGFQDSTKST